MGKLIGSYYFHEKKDAELLLNAWNTHRENGLYHAYAKPGPGMRKAWEHCKRICYAVGGEGLCVTGHNTYFFTVSFVITDGETGEITDVVKITPDYNYIAHIKN